MDEAAWKCAECGAQVAPGAPRCPECPSVSFTRPEPAKPFFGQLADVDAVLAEANADDAPALPPALPPMPPGSGM